MKMNNYEKRARVYPAIVAMVVPVIFTTVFFSGIVKQWLPSWTIALRFLVAFVPVATVYAALGYMSRELFRWTSKQIFQFPIFNEDETNMPTTRLLLWSDSSIPDESKKVLRQKIENKYGKQLYGKKQEEAKPKEAALAIAHVVRSIRQDTREDKILLQYNYEYGFSRNYLGASIWAIAFILIFWIINAHSNVLPNNVFVIALLCQVVLDLFVFVSMKHNAKAYARQLFASFQSKY